MTKNLKSKFFQISLRKFKISQIGLWITRRILDALTFSRVPKWKLQFLDFLNIFGNSIKYACKRMPLWIQKLERTSSTCNKLLHPFIDIGDYIQQKSFQQLCHLYPARILSEKTRNDWGLSKKAATMNALHMIWVYMPWSSLTIIKYHEKYR